MESIAQLDQLTEVLQKRLNEALATLTNQEVAISMKQSAVVTIQEVQEAIDKSQNVTTIYIPLMGDVTGDIFLFLNDNAANNVADMMIGNEPGTTQFITDFEQSALKEMGNITTGVIVTEMANMLKLSIMLTVPNIANDMAGALVDQVLIEYSETSTNLMSIMFPFNIESINAEGSFLLLFDNAASEVIRAKLNSGETTQEAHV